MPTLSPVMTHLRPTSPASKQGRTLAALLAPVADLSLPFSRATFGARTWETLVRDGDVIELWDGHGLPPGVRATPLMRARSLLQHVPRDVVVGRRTAAWIHTGFPRPARLCVLYTAGGYRPRRTTGLDVSQAALRPWDLQSIGGLRVTDLTRTALDVATWGSPEEVQPILSVLLRHGLDLDVCRQRLDRVASWRGAECARDNLDAAAAAALADRTASAEAAGAIRIERVRPPGVRDDQDRMRVSAVLDPVIR